MYPFECAATKRACSNMIATGRKAQNNLIAASWVEFNLGATFQKATCSDLCLYSIGATRNAATHDQKYATGIKVDIPFIFTMYVL